MKRLLICVAAVAALLPLGARADSKPCLTLGGQSYCRAWSDKNSAMMKTEFLRAGETVDHWQNMVTVIRYNDVHTIKAAVANYMQVVSQYLAPDARPQWVTPKDANSNREVATRLVLSTPDGSDSEYVVAYFKSHPDTPSYAIAFSQHIPLPSGKTPTMEQYGNWLKDMRAIDPAAVTR
ncbi:MAG TPA: hypothetical protein VK760_13365 [Candidatus Acidoferrales bacterium]|nr:hypothetical protein [Candidatus Acidoferrales bacterium]